MKRSEKLKKFFNSPHPIMIAFTLIIIFLFAYNVYISKSSKLYEFNGVSENFYLEDGILYLGRDIHLFNGAHITFIGDDVTVTEYECGYYFENGTQISVFKSSEENAKYNLEEVIDSMRFSLMEKNRDSLIFDGNTDVKKIIFKVKAILEDGTSFEEEIKLEFNQLTK